MGIGILKGFLKTDRIKLGNIDIKSVYVGRNLVWPDKSGPTPDPDIDIDDLIAALSCITTGHWEDVLPWNDKTPWMDKVYF